MRAGVRRGGGGEGQLAAGAFVVALVVFEPECFRGKDPDGGRVGGWPRRTARRTRPSRTRRRNSVGASLRAWTRTISRVPHRRRSRGGWGWDPAWADARARGGRARGLHHGLGLGGGVGGSGRGGSRADPERQVLGRGATELEVGRAHPPGGGGGGAGEEGRSASAPSGATSGTSPAESTGGPEDDASSAPSGASGRESTGEDGRSTPGDDMARERRCATTTQVPAVNGWLTRETAETRVKNKPTRAARQF